MTFMELLDRLRSGKRFEQVNNGNFYVECFGNYAYEDGDFYNYMECLGVEDIDFGVGYAVFFLDNGKIYEVPYEMKENRFDTDLPEEILLEFDIQKIYDVTGNYYYDENEDCYYKKGE